LRDAPDMEFLCWETRGWDTFPFPMARDFISESCRRKALPTSLMINCEDIEETELCLGITEDGNDDDLTGSRMWEIFDPFEQV